MTAMTPCLDRPGFLPRLSSHHQPRPRLSAPLLASNARVRLLCAPAGSGKTALLSECLLQVRADCETIWLPLAGAALSCEEFCLRLTQALGLVEHLDVAQLMAELARWPRTTSLFIDDYSRLPDPALDALLDRLLAVSSPALTWWISTRRRPQCNWPRLLLDDELYESERASLALTHDELVPVLRHLPPDQADRVAAGIIQRTGGWCAGARMALLQKCDWSQKLQPQQRVDTLLDYLQHELFSNLTPEQDEAWRVLAQLPRFNAPLCEHLFGPGEGAQLLHDLQVLGCFIEPWQESVDWLQVFRPLSRIMQESHWPCARSWHRRACQWFTAVQDWRAAFEQALLAEEYETAVSLLQHLSFEDLLEDQTVVLLLRLHEQQSRELTLMTPQLIGLVTGALLFAGRFEQAAQCMAHLVRFMPQPTKHLEQQLLARWQAQQGWLCHLQGQMEQARACFQEALSALTDDAWQARLMCLSGLTQQALLCGELDQAHALNREALCLARAHGSLLFEGLLELDHAQWLEQRGAPARAESLLVDIEHLLRQRTLVPTPLLGRIALRRGRLALCMGLEERAADLFSRGLEDCLRSEDKRVLYGYLGQAQLAGNRGDYACAFERLREAERVMQQRQIPDTVYRGVVLQVSSQFWLQQGRPQLVQEALGRLLRHYRGPSALQAPPATFELIIRIEYLLACAHTQLNPDENCLPTIERLLNQAQARGMLTAETELLLAFAQLAESNGDTEAAQQAFQRAGMLVERCQLQHAMREWELRRGSLGTVSAKQIPARQCDNPDLASGLSRREREVLMLIAQGASNQQVAEQLFISLHTVKTHARRINGKLGVERRTQAVAKAKLMGILA
ncbi:MULTISPECIES: LuxR C-terminal-related transcriptional regulator [unclassified Pseudomonas]|uniref:LuxR C-terminal-related transcriptional regulator n=1 Tax=unclassified Pseudomonas TaxID=196821 RepID=UPI0002722858|nr:MULTISPECIES: LuxR C-terminal-related transcriptional regulator [unclassified Pseudomonas]EJM02120.1 ATP-dependent transcriptional regulator [Pseudomonas sp. GM16]EJM27077.1 ATP-dependent transcriptional regulator [Pseudomonas sp. GM24]